MSITKQRQQTAYLALAEAFGYTSPMQSPRIMKIIVSSGVGKKRDKKQLELIEDRLAKITGQKAASRGARLSIASFKVREGDTVGLQVTLRGARMYDFLDKLIHIALPRTRDFRGISPKAIDDMGNITIGIKEHTIFPETSDEDLKDVFGFAVTIVTTSHTKAEAEAFFRHLGLPLIVETVKK
ncbi:50S ribosomal protein L5 [Candidatus Kaiserbacteria bacterium RIFCSPLOWO2_01_FULL_52_12b]|uniref:Large ribosomal subunit protein uL5 n=1 Tax=Candidatus Kaiserbacteria bacterium RIFCSPLOWO2_01_FULL_52_12b TaxID=1798509 RepID=A0A1F6EX93_9BACT|nr:MAG: 50S ribosomal protein L5 [Candidatus Kaiserbacteria bacterium RIFCSPLOWO2_01_FULL_52_12b]